MYWACQQPLRIRFSNIRMCTRLLLPCWRIYSQWSSGIWDSLFIPFRFIWLKIVLQKCGRLGLKSFFTHYLFMFHKLLAVHGPVFYKRVEQRSWHSYWIRSESGSDGGKALEGIPGVHSVEEEGGLDLGKRRGNYRSYPWPIGGAFLKMPTLAGSLI